MRGKREVNLYCSFHTENTLLSGNEEEKWKMCRTFTPNFLGSMFDAIALSPVFVFEPSAQLPIRHAILRRETQNIGGQPAFIR